MKKILYYISFLAITLCPQSCAEKVDKDLTWPKWSSRPVISGAKMDGGGQNSVTAGSKVSFSANISDKYNELEECTLSVLFGKDTVFQKTIDLNGNNYDLKVDFVLPFSANLPEQEIYPDVTLTVLNAKGGKNQITLNRENNVSVSRPQSPPQLYIVDDAGNIFTLLRMSNTSYEYKTADNTDFSRLGKSFYIAFSTNGSKPDLSDIVLGQDGDQIILADSSTLPIVTPETEGYTIKSMRFNLFSFKLSKIIDCVITVDKNKMNDESAFMAIYNMLLVKDCEIKFKGFGDLKSMLQPDRFEIEDNETAVFTGQTNRWNLLYHVSSGWLITNYANTNASGQLWVTGANACFPLGNDGTTTNLSWFADTRFAALSAVKSSEDDFSIVIYLKNSFEIQLYRWFKWSTVVRLISDSNDIGYIHPNGVSILPGSKFTPGLYLFVVHLTNQGDANGDGSSATVSIQPYSL